MKAFAAKDAKNRFGQFLDAAQTSPVGVTKNGRTVAVMMSLEQYERLRGVAWDQLTATMDAMGREAADKGLTEADLDAMLADES